MDLLNKLQGGDRRSIGNANKVVKMIKNNQRLFDEIFTGIFDTDPIIRMRAADVIEKVSQKHPHLLKKHKKTILSKIDQFDQQEVKWHVALMLSYMQLTEKEASAVFIELSNWAINNKSQIVRVNSLQALADIALKYSHLKSKIYILINDQIRNGSPSIRSRGKKLLEKLQ
ncbi:MAG: hypothetical protein GY865_13730 [candidate division Zixibacteria bacterium]|nr:hypothetical protein [candidate division Zixibacteria bacterium]